MRHGLFRSQAILVIVSQQLVKKVNGVVANEALVLSVDERVPWLLGISAKYVVVLGIELNVVLVKIVEQIFCSQNLCDLDQLIGITVPVEKWLPPEDHGREHGSQ